MCSELTNLMLFGDIFTEILPLIDGRRSTEEIVSRLSHKYTESHLYLYFLKLEEQGFIEETIERREGSSNAFLALLRADSNAGPDMVETGIYCLGETEAYGMLLLNSITEGSLPIRAGLHSGYNKAIKNWIVISPDYLEPELQRFNRFALDNGISWFLFKPVGVIPWFGPLFVPGRTGCYACMSKRLRGNQNLNSIYQSRAKNGTGLRVSTGMTSYSVSAAIGLFTAELDKWSRGSIDFALEGTLVSYDFKKIATGHHSVDKRPQCLACGGQRKDEKIRLEQMDPVVLVSQKKSEYWDNGHRVLDSDKTYSLMSPYIDPLTGLISNIEHLPGVPEALGYQYMAKFAFEAEPDSYEKRRSFPTSISGGKGMTKRQAVLSALGEAIEHYAAAFHGEETLLRSRYADIEEIAVPPYALMGCTYDEYLAWEEGLEGKRPEWESESFRMDKEIDWFAAWSLSQKRWKMIPASAVYTRYPPEDGHAYVDAATNGLAAGTCLEEALIHGLFELIERDATAIWWYNRLKKPAVDINSFDLDWTARIAPALEAEGWSFHVLDVSSDFNVPVFIAAALNDLDPFDPPRLGFGADFEPKIALSRAVSELGQGWFWMPKFTIRDFCLEHDSNPLARMDFMNPDWDVPARKYSDFPKQTTDNFLTDLEKLIEVYRGLAMEPLFVDLTRPDIALKVIRVFAPGLVRFWPRISDKRLREVPIKLGWLSEARTTFNPIPFFYSACGLQLGDLK